MKNKTNRRSNASPKRRTIGSIESSNGSLVPAPFTCNFDLILENLIKIFSRTSALELNLKWPANFEIQLNHMIIQFELNSPDESGLSAKRRSKRIENRQLAIKNRMPIANYAI